MKIAKSILPLSLGLMVASVLAQESNVPGKGNPGGMSEQDYLIQREKILMRMKAASPQQQDQRSDQEGNARRAPAPTHGSTYGQGYGSRKEAGDAADKKPPIGAAKPERPARPERAERPHIERPGRP